MNIDIIIKTLSLMLKSLFYSEIFDFVDYQVSVKLV